MSFILSEEQQILKRASADFVASRSSLRRIRGLRDSGDPAGFSRDLWKEMASLGWTGILIPEKHGGAGLGFQETALVLEELGRGLMPEPMIPTVLLGASAILLAGSDEQKKEILPAVADGDLFLAVAWLEPEGRFDPERVKAVAERKNGGWVLHGRKHLVLGGSSADRIIVSARTSGAEEHRSGVSLFLLDTDARGVRRTPQRLLDSRDTAIVDLDDVAVDDRALVGSPDYGAELLEAVLDRGTAGLCAEMLGSTGAVFDMTLEYLKTRKQFGKLIGSFQALQHRAATLFIEIELARSAVMAVNRALDENASNARTLVSVAKARLSDAFLLTANEAVQMHGGIGMTDEHDVGFFLKRARVAEMTFGDAAWHRERFARLSGY